MKQKPDILFEWDTPQELINHQAMKNLQRWLRVIPMTMVAAILLEIALFIPIFLILKKCGPEYQYLMWKFAKIFLLAIPGVLIFTIGLVALEQITMRWAPKWTGKPYQITNEAMLVRSNKYPKIPWKKMMFIGITPHEELEKCQYLCVFYKKRKRSIPLPKSEEANTIISFVSNHAQIKKDKRLFEEINLTKKQKQLINTSTGAYILFSLIIYYSLANIFTSNGNIYMAALIWFFINLLIGPGTVSMFFFYRSLYFQREDLQLKAMRYNLVIPSLIYLVAIIAFFQIMIKDVLNTIGSLP